MKTTMSIVSESFENEQTGETVEGVTIMIDGILKDVLETMMLKDPHYSSPREVIADALFKGLEVIKNGL